VARIDKKDRKQAREWRMDNRKRQNYKNLNICKLAIEIVADVFNLLNEFSKD
jgi:hypothetical protein